MTSHGGHDVIRDKSVKVISSRQATFWGTTNRAGRPSSAACKTDTSPSEDEARWFTAVLREGRDNFLDCRWSLSQTDVTGVRVTSIALMMEAVRTSETSV
jgi:hypothetical protein